MPGETTVDSVDRSMQRRKKMIQLVKQHLLKAQQRMKMQADKRRSERSFAIGEWVWLKLQAYRQHSVQQRVNQKLAPKYYGPFQIEDTIEKVAYKLKLPDSAKILNIFHVSQLKIFRGKLPAMCHIPLWMQGNTMERDIKPEKVLDKRIVKRQNAAAVQYLIQWEGCSVADATWEFYDHLLKEFPEFMAKVSEEA
ncbi:unnamed protein product [Cuscuta epithymum]|uniref:Chromo domain-containing protein n=1 Tax=Cuscuta epithymum TaxID=186058 RepID=A0AAV0FBM5_9ASTE|nr:unnamed protein product [Cuscuta epithymum]